MRNILKYYYTKYTRTRVHVCIIIIARRRGGEVGKYASPVPRPPARAPAQCVNMIIIVNRRRRRPAEPEGDAPL